MIGIAAMALIRALIKEKETSILPKAAPINK